ncbi:N2227-like protein-domain-containing protein [Paraphoma chrysanthemicola]|uniref:N2227-like protein-domain-containing protein n=1 Tax=Paraphoma chrysanthemicola TaxID=798071 RepID=A0A8K0VU72_9PLEO|nr:N2227-like protein-domain-containing protein [Paraphoma chrysanthemicola]
MRINLLHLLLLVNGNVFAATNNDNAASIVHREDPVETLTFDDGPVNIQDPIQMRAMPIIADVNSPRHRQERAHLLRRMARNHGTWGSTHPRLRLLDTLFGFTKYKERQIIELNRWRNLYTNVGKKQKKVLERVVNYKKKLDDVEELIYENLMICKSIVSNALQFYGVTQQELDEHIKDAEEKERQADRISVSQALKHFVRDWADEGAKERNDAFPCILSTLSGLKGVSKEPSPLKVLLPGSGLGRLGHEVANLDGFEVTLNEWSMYMNVAYRFIENSTLTNPFSFHPFVDGFSHHATTTDMLRKVTAPNVTPNSKVLLVEGDFNTAFKDQAGHYDIIVTHFFIDTARNLMSYFDTIQLLLKTGGKWLNFGPLLYGTAPFVQLSLDEIIAVVEEMGFAFEDIGDDCGEITFDGKKPRSKEAEYGFNGKALTKNAYAAQVWVVTKK